MFDQIFTTPFGNTSIIVKNSGNSCGGGCAIDPPKQKENEKQFYS